MPYVTPFLRPSCGAYTAPHTSRASLLSASNIWAVLSSSSHRPHIPEYYDSGLLAALYVPLSRHGLPSSLCRPETRRHRSSSVHHIRDWPPLATMWLTICPDKIPPILVCRSLCRRWHRIQMEFPVLQRRAILRSSSAAKAALLWQCSDSCADDKSLRTMEDDDFRCAQDAVYFFGI
jgi:hypothetical protein